MQVDGVFGYLAKATLNLDIVICCFCRIVHCDFIGFDSMLYSHISPDSSTLIKYPFNVRERKGKNPSTPKKSTIAFKLPREWGEERLKIWQAFGFCFVLVPATYASLVLDKRSGSGGRGVPAPLGKAAYLESWDSLEDALIEQGRIEGDSQPIMGCSRRLYLDLFIILN